MPSVYGLGTKSKPIRAMGMVPHATKMVAQRNLMNVGGVARNGDDSLRSKGGKLFLIAHDAFWRYY